MDLDLVREALKVRSNVCSQTVDEEEGSGISNTTADRKTIQSMPSPSPSQSHSSASTSASASSLSNLSAAAVARKSEREEVVEEMYWMYNSSPRPKWKLHASGKRPSQSQSQSQSKTRGGKPRSRQNTAGSRTSRGDRSQQKKDPRNKIGFGRRKGRGRDSSDESERTYFRNASNYGNAVYGFNGSQTARSYFADESSENNSNTFAHHHNHHY